MNSIQLKEGQIVLDEKGRTYLIEKGDAILLTEKESALDSLTNEDLVDELITFIKTNPFPTDDSYHAFAEEKGYDPDEIEQYAYAMLSVFLTGGASRGFEIEADKDNIDIGLEIEKEHVHLDIDNVVVNKIQKEFARKIMNDHLAETNTYYVDGVDFIEELNKEK